MHCFTCFIETANSIGVYAENHLAAKLQAAGVLKVKDYRDVEVRYVKTIHFPAALRNSPKHRDGGQV